MRTADLDEALDAVGEVFLPHQVDVLGRASELDTQLNVLRLGNLTAGYLRYGPEIRDADRGGVQLLPASGIRRPVDVSRGDSAQLGVSVALRGDGPSGRRGDGEGRRHARGLECKLHG